MGKKHALRLAALDLDGTLAPVGRGIAPQTVRMLRELEARGVRIALCSGKPVYYLCGLLRQVELRRPLLLGENGAVFQEGIDLPPERFAVLPYPPEAGEAFVRLKRELEAAVPGMWYQPNQVGLTPFPRSEAEFARVAEVIAAARARGALPGIEVYRHADSFDIVPACVSKAAGLALLHRELGIPPEEMAAVGDGVNDFPMFAYAGLAIGIGVAHPEAVDANVRTVDEAMGILLARTE